MKIFVCNRKSDLDESKKLVEELKKASDNKISILREEEHSENWKLRVEKKFQEVDFVVFVIGATTFESTALKWEYAKAKKLNKRIVGLSAENASEENVLYCQGFPVFDNSIQCLAYLEEIFRQDRQLLIEQYKIMVSSTEKVTEQRLKVNNLFFTVISSILSISFVVGKVLGFSVIGITGMLIVTIMAFLISVFWEKLIQSYGTLNTGKFTVIAQIEKQLRTNMFEHEWNVLKNQLKYEANTETEKKVIRWFRRFIVTIGIIEIGCIFTLLDYDNIRAIIKESYNVCKAYIY